MARSSKERLGNTVACDACGKMGRERLSEHPVQIKSWACSPQCGKVIMDRPGWGSLGWLKV